MRRLARLAALLAAVAGPARAAAFDWQQHLGQSLPLTEPLRAETGVAVTLARMFHGVPVILDLGYFRCPSLCGIARSDLFAALSGAALRAGRDYELVSVSIDPHETPADAAAAKRKDAGAWPGLDASHWQYLTGTQGAVAAVAQAAGFPFSYNVQWRQFLHPTGLVVASGAGVVSAYLLGVGYTPGDLRAAVIRARAGGIARAALPILLLCFHFDTSTGRYTLAIMKVLRLMGVLTVATVAGLLVLLQRRGGRGAA